MTDNVEQDEALLYRIRVTLTDRLSTHVSTPPEQRAEVSRALTDAITPDIREALTAARAEVEKLRRQVMGYRGLMEVYLRERNAAHAELIKAENLIERLCYDREAGQGVVKAALTEQRERAERAERERDEALAAVADEQRRADERRTELLEERDEALDALGEAERRAEQAEAETTALRERAENAEDRLRKATDAYTRLHAEATGTEATGDRWRQRAEQAERAARIHRDERDEAHERAQQAEWERDQALAALTTHAAEQTSHGEECGDYDPAVGRTNPMTAPPPEYLDADQPEEPPLVEHTGGNAEDCPICRPLIDQPGGVLYPWHCTAAETEETP